MIPERVIDIDGSLINPPAEYYAAREAMGKLIDVLEVANVDRSDMWTMMTHLQSEANFHMTMLPSRQKR